MGSTPAPAVAHFRGALAIAQVFKARMTISNRLVTLQVLAALHNSVALNTATNNKAASTYVNCNCQCSSLTFQDKFGRTQGNCKTADNTGATWCYVDSRSPCLDKQRSVRFSQSGHAWSYQACSTPPRHSTQCSGFGSSGQYNPTNNGGQYNPYGNNGQQVSLGSILQGRKKKDGSVNFS